MTDRDHAKGRGGGGARRARTAVWCSDDLQKLARRRLPRIIYDFVEGGAGRERTAAWNNAAFDRLHFIPCALDGSGEPSLKTELFGEEYAVPFGVAPIGVPDLVWPGTAAALAHLASRVGMPFILSSAASISIETAADLAGRRLWFQLYAGDRPEVTVDLLRRAAEVGVRNLVITIDVARPARRIRDLRNGLKADLKPSLVQLIDFLRHPRWLNATMKSGRPALANMTPYLSPQWPDASFIAAPRVDWAKLRLIRETWRGNLIVKGVLSPEEAVKIEAVGAQGVIVSNHGGRQLDGVPAAIDALPAIRDILKPSTKVLFDGGIRHGSDVVKAFAQGSDFVFLGRSWLYAAAALGPEEGPGALLTILREETENVLALLGQDTLPGRATEPKLEAFGRETARDALGGSVIRENPHFVKCR